MQVLDQQVAAAGRVAKQREHLLTRLRFHTAPLGGGSHPRTFACGPVLDGRGGGRTLAHVVKVGDKQRMLLSPHVRLPPADTPCTLNSWAFRASAPASPRSKSTPPRWASCSTSWPSGSPGSASSSPPARSIHR